MVSPCGSLPWVASGSLTSGLHLSGLCFCCSSWVNFSERGQAGQSSTRCGLVVFFFTLVFLLLWERAQGRLCRLGSTLQGRSCTKHGAHEGSRWLQLAPTACGLLIGALRALLFCPSLPAEISQELDDEGRVEKCIQAAVV